jgi:hypothetical protein
MSKEDGNLTILHDMYTKEGSDEEIEGLTVLVDGIMKQFFDKIKEEQGYDNYSEVLRDVIFEGVNSIVTEE